MGWFWAETSPRVNALPIASHPISTNAASPPSACPMHKSGAKDAVCPSRRDKSSQKPSSCPVKSPSHPLRFPTSPSPPQNNAVSSSPATVSESSILSKLNPLNYMPNLTNAPIHTEQTHTLPLEREASSIPRGDADSNWEYPSPQQMYNAMLRKGYTETPSDAVESMVAVHNFLNEGAWNEIMEWESIFSKGLAHGWQMCSKGEQNMKIEKMKQERMKARKRAIGQEVEEEPSPKLLRFMGRPGEPSPRARMLQFMGWAFPESYSQEPPFDRHDWYVARQTPKGVKEVRYVIDYYAAGTQETGEPVFYLDIRPALDTPTAAVERMMRWGGDVWWRASGAEARVQTQTQKQKS